MTGPHAQRCLVLGCGGVTGLAWEIGLLAGLAECGVDLAQADLFIGCSAGSVVGAQLAQDVPLDQLLRSQLAPADISAEQFRPYSQQAADEKNRQLFDKVGADLQRARQRIGAYARRSLTPALAARRAIIASRLASTQWPTRPLQIVAVDTETGAGRSFSARDNVDFIDAIAASCAVPGSWPAVPIGQATYMDGGIRSMTNADMAMGCAKIVVLAPLGYRDSNPVSGHLRGELQTLLAAGSQAHAVLPDAVSEHAIGDNLLDPAQRAAAAQAGFMQAAAIAQAVSGIWKNP